jgi:hypothetical protein
MWDHKNKGLELEPFIIEILKFEESEKGGTLVYENNTRTSSYT